jgi:hypothetical protein
MTGLSFAYEITLKDGRAIITDACWLENGYVNYYKFGSKISIPEDRIESIVYNGKKLIADEAQVVFSNGRSLLVKNLTQENDIYTCIHDNAPLVFPKKNVKNLTIKRPAVLPHATENNTSSDFRKMIYSPSPIDENSLKDSAPSQEPNYEKNKPAIDNHTLQKIKTEVQLPPENRLAGSKAGPISNPSAKSTTTKIYDERGRLTNDPSYLDKKGRPLYNEKGNFITYTQKICARWDVHYGYDIIDENGAPRGPSDRTCMKWIE